MAPTRTGRREEFLVPSSPPASRRRCQPFPKRDYSTPAGDGRTKRSAACPGSVCDGTLYGATSDGPRHDCWIRRQVSHPGQGSARRARPPRPKLRDSDLATEAGREFTRRGHLVTHQSFPGASAAQFDASETVLCT